MRNQGCFIIPVDKFDPVTDYGFRLSKHTQIHINIPLRVLICAIYFPVLPNLKLTKSTTIHPTYT